jgi:uncharacterized membrane protein HdeD (DUF308 family)
MANSKRIGALLGPTLLVMLVAEFPLVQPHLYDAQIPPVVYLSGVLMFVAGLAIVRAHNVWTRNWTVLVTLCGWFFLVLGVVRAFAASQYRQASADASPRVFIAVEAFGLVVALWITYRSYRRDDV